ncbi:MAG: hypothetical protein HON53_15825 [Planctomycetaceae bacterium]|jgi:hypothetical protein|nr:hypothetical protein [Planctomycetaceae bacterium]MBT6155417.1 hypothetical protein [Planctomycetaceae bacterium]MBT6487589.1 hypothetical protein [Planctomycetaceae bacterium]MBT6493247.1 hypothetical protein [Planctomycetaceae bacterium]
MKDRRQVESIRNMGTFAALAVLLLIGIGLLALVAVVLPKVIWLVVVVLGFFLMGLFHYVTWGWWLSRLPVDDDEPVE